MAQTTKKALKELEDTIEMLRQDANDLKKILTMFRNKQWSKALEAYWTMDTNVREWIPRHLVNLMDDEAA